MLQLFYADDDVVFGQFLYYAASFLPVIGENLQFLLNKSCDWGFFSFIRGQVKLFPYVCQIPVHLLFLVMGNPPISLVPRALGHQDYYPALFLPPGPSPPLYAPYCARHRLIEDNQVHFWYVKPLLAYGCRDNHIEQAISEVIKHLLLLLLAQSSIAFFLLPDKDLGIDACNAVELVNNVN